MLSGISIRRRFLIALMLLVATIIGGVNFLVTPTTQAQSALLQAGDFQYLGAFRLPMGDMRPNTFEYGGNAMTFNPNGDSSGASDGFTGSLFITGHDRLAYGEMPDGSRVAEITIPAPIIASNVGELNRAEFLQPLTDVAEGFFTNLDEIPRIGLEYLNTPATGELIHITWGQHFQPDTAAPSHAWFSPDLANANMQGSWFIGGQNPYSVNGYLFEIPTDWADTYVDGRYLATGRYRDGGWSGMGPALFAYRPWVDEQGTPAADGSQLEAIPLLLYKSSSDTENIEGNMLAYQHPDEWEGGAWLTTADGRTGVLFAGTKAVGDMFWYGWVNPLGAELPCIEEELLGQFELCRLADGNLCSPEHLQGCEGHNDYRGWWSSEFNAQFILYNPDDLAQVALGNMSPEQPQPYISIVIDDYLFLNPDNVESEMLGAGIQQRGRIGATAYDRKNQRLYVLELFADGAQPVVHVWQIG